jgi:hypothetical protein
MNATKCGEKMTRVIDEDGSRPYARDLASGTGGRSGYSYVVGELDTSYRYGDGPWIPGLHRGAIPIRTPLRCDHRECVCTECAESWMFDWRFYLDRTAGGRRLRDDLGGEAALDAMAARRLAWDAGCRRAATPAITAPPAS